MKLRIWPILITMISIVALAAEEAPPAELLQNMDFYQNMNMIQDQQFLDMATRKQENASAPIKQGPVTVDTATIRPLEKTDASN